ncbi:nucleoside 2-deoxyribosyltransferase [Salirhabdus euzebyi]|uniref:Nucleoside 2-deoxyribosyltransferase n=1 Tax=Salirhabdus euzebyi TaxID=394506 RepID=A0A841Q8W3_9BACI|nr:nucleoside 2-deoxyribosyltransferase [Salirhabdus euzebyi]MBB6454754.1 nucleoside 2-deoxyribosyltransferase [Salirhabdus euzebyi]
MNFYVASSFHNKEMVQQVVEELKFAGFLHTYDWTKNERASTLDELKRIGKKEREAVKNADFLVMLMPGGAGTHVELGIALGLNKRIYLYSPDHDIYDYERSCTFYYVDGVYKYVGLLENFIKEVTLMENNIQ